MRTLAIVVLLLSACHPTVSPAPVPPEADAGSSEASRIPSACKAAAANVRRMRCAGYQGSPGADERFGTADDVSFERVCADLESVSRENGVPSYSLHPECIAAASNCTAVAQCAR
jgi:hypothetical protein